MRLLVNEGYIRVNDPKDQLTFFSETVAVARGIELYGYDKFTVIPITITNNDRSVDYAYFIKKRPVYGS